MLDTPQLIFLNAGHAHDVIADIDTKTYTVSSLEFVIAGRLRLWIDDRLHEIDGPRFWTNVPGVRSRYTSAPDSGPWEHGYVVFHGPRVDVWRRAGLLPVMPQDPPAGEDCLARFDQLVQLSQARDVWSQRRAVNLLEQILLILAQARSQQPDDHGWLADVLRLLQDIPVSPRQYESLARKLGMSLSTFRRRFRQATGTSPHEWLVRRRIYRAQSLLVDTDWPIKRIADELGYCDVYYFSRQFHEIAGLPPAAFRQSARQRGGSQ
ncbi:MAG: helix-turn-helix transcriptional regulator [Phycisphaeraceae bacterium]|nr:helix-turn-helix transcriptional regulator [Phycisphaeraceae bacterium]